MMNGPDNKIMSVGTYLEKSGYLELYEDHTGNVFRMKIVNKEYVFVSNINYSKYPKGSIVADSFSFNSKGYLIVCKLSKAK